jgi:hypothetical protein
MINIIRNYKVVVREEDANSPDHDLGSYRDTPIARFEETVPDAKIHEFMFALNPKIKYRIQWEDIRAEVIGALEVDKYILINQKKSEIAKLKLEIEGMERCPT